MSGSQGFRDSSEIEALGRDGKQGRYNYYNPDRSGTENQRLLWKWGFLGWHGHSHSRTARRNLYGLPH